MTDHDKKATELILEAAKESGMLEAVEQLLVRHAAADVRDLFVNYFDELAGTAPITMGFIADRGCGVRKPAKPLMEAELMFGNSEARDRAIVDLGKLGLEVELLDQVDEHTPTVWIKVTGPYEGSDDEFFREMRHLARRFGGGVEEAGLQFPPSNCFH